MYVRGHRVALITDQLDDVENQPSGQFWVVNRVHAVGLWVRYSHVGPPAH